MGLTTAPSGGGASSPQLPAWTYTAGTIGSGLFTTDNATYQGTTVITLSSSVVAYNPGLSVLVPGTRLLFTDSAGGVVVFNASIISGPGGNTEFAVIFNGPNGVWGGKYSLSFAPIVQTPSQIGLGNVDNTSDATKFTSPALTAVPTAPTAPDSTNTTQVATTAFVNVANAQANSGITPVANGTYTVGLGLTVDGTITTVRGIITAIQEAS